jgi:CelD/BcsL family acetyltransferase involved in cellulose biosynthesis
MCVELLSTVAAVESVAADWLRLHQCSDSATPFNHPLWVLSWWHWRELGLKWRCYVCHGRDGRLAGVLPLVGYPDGTVRFAGHDLHDVASAVAGHREQGVLWQRAVDDAREAREATVFELPTLGDHDLAALRVASSGTGPQVSGFDPGARIVLPGSWEEFWASLSATRRKRMAAERRALERHHGAVRFEMVDSADGVLRAVDELWMLREISWQARGRYEELASHVRGPVLRTFLATLAARCAGTGLVAVGRLAVDDGTIGSALLLRTRGRAWYAMCAFAADFSRYGPGRLLLSECVRAAVDIGLSSLELGRGVEGYKFALGATRYEVADVSLMLAADGC